MKFTKLPPGVAKGAYDLQTRATRRNVGKSGVRTKKPLPFGTNVKVLKRNAKLHRMMKDGKIPRRMPKAEMRSLYEQALVGLNLPKTSST